MAFQSLPGAALWPPVSQPAVAGGALSSGTQKTMDAATEKAALIGHVTIYDPATGKLATSAKTISAAGGGSIVIRTGVSGNALADPATSVDVGIQDVASGAGPQPQPDGAFDVSATLVGGTDTWPNSTWKSVAMETGSKSIAQGALIAVVIDMTARGGSDVVLWATAAATNPGLPCSNVFLSGAWQSTSQHELPGCYVVFDDGSFGVFESTAAVTFATTNNTNFNDTSNPDEYGYRFQLPFDAKVIGYWATCSGSVAAADFSLRTYSDPEGSPVLVTGSQLDVLGEQVIASAGRPGLHYLSSVFELTKNTDYVVAVRATGASNITLGGAELPNENFRNLYMGPIARATRQNDTGAFTIQSPATTNHYLGLILAEADFSPASGGVTPLGNGLHPIGQGISA